jgi:hypothetical protein
MPRAYQKSMREQVGGDEVKEPPFRAAPPSGILFKSEALNTFDGRLIFNGGVSLHQQGVVRIVLRHENE